MIESKNIIPIDAIYITNQGPSSLASLQIFLQPIEFMGEINNTSIRLDGIEIKKDAIEQLQNRTLQFPINPNKGYIDGSIYLTGRHEYVDVTEFSFRSFTLINDAVFGTRSRVLPTRMVGNIVLIESEHETKIALNLDVNVRVPLNKTEMSSMLQFAAKEIGAETPKDVGKLIAYVRPLIHYETQMGALANLAKRLFK